MCAVSIETNSFEFESVHPVLQLIQIARTRLSHVMATRSFCRNRLNRKSRKKNIKIFQYKKQMIRSQITNLYKYLMEASYFIWWESLPLFHSIFSKICYLLVNKLGKIFANNKHSIISWNLKIFHHFCLTSFQENFRYFQTISFNE